MMALPIIVLGGCMNDGAGTESGHASAALTGPGITGSRTAGGWGLKNLSTEGTLDWAHWGLTGIDSFNHKSGVTPQISNFTRLGTASTLELDCCADTFSWTGGTPTVSASSVIGGVYVDTPNVSGDGFQISIPADTTTKTLKLYTGYWCARAKLQATLSDGSAPPLVDTSADLTNAADTSVYTIDFRAAANGQTLTVNYTIDLNHCTNGDTGEVWLLAATLAGTSVCTPTTCAAQGKNCGTISDGCGGTLNCGSCTSPQTCGGGGTPNVCGTCTPTTCAAQGKNCGTISDGCGGTLNCGSCTSPQTCGGAGTPNVCGSASGKLAGSRTGGGWSASNLSTEGTTDWAHWGLTGVSSFNHRSGVTPQISNFTRLGTASTLWLDCCTGTFSWTGGTPTTSASNVIGGVYVDTPNVSGDGFRITIPADTSPKTLQLYTGYWCARAKLQASLSDGSAPAYVDTSADLTNAADSSVYTLDFHSAASGQTLTVDYIIDLNHCTSGDTGEVWLLAATLSSAGPCTPTTCAAQGKNCGSISDGCGGTLACGTCTAPQTCGGGGVPNVCGTCTPTTCAAQGKNCGSISDGCGGTLDCGTCIAPQTCGGGGVPNVCGTGSPPPPFGESVFERNHHKNRDGWYVQPTFTSAGIGTMKLDTAFAGTITGDVYAQVLYVDNVALGTGSTNWAIAVTQNNQVSALDAQTGAVVWQKTLGPNAARDLNSCSDNFPLGIQGTPIIDPTSRTMFLDAVIGTQPDGSGTIKTHQIHALSIDDGSERPNFPVDTGAASYQGTTFDPTVQNQRAALAFLNGTIYVAYGSFGDCYVYHGWVLGVPYPAGGPITAYATAVSTATYEAGIWGPGGISSDGTNLFVASGNAFNATSWVGQEAIIRLQPGPSFSNQTVDYFAPHDYLSLDTQNLDIGGSGPVLITAKNATPSNLVVAMGKNGYLYLLDQTNLGGVAQTASGDGLFNAHIANGELINVAAWVNTSTGNTWLIAHGYMGATGVGCKTGAGNLIAMKISGTPPTASIEWCADSATEGEPMITTSDAAGNDAIVWFVGQHLNGWNIDTGAHVYAGTDSIGTLQRFTTPIAANGRIYIGANNKVYSFKL